MSNPMRTYIIELGYLEDAITIGRMFRQDDGAFLRRLAADLAAARNDPCQPWLKVVDSEEASDEMRRAVGLPSLGGSE